MNENEDFSQVQRRLCAVIAKSEWTSSRMRMQKSGEELRESRAKSNRTANKFLQDLFEKRGDGDLIDDNGAVDRYNKFLKNKSALNDDTNSSLDEFDRRLRALNNHRRNQTIKSSNQSLNTTSEKNSQYVQNDLPSTIENEDEKKEVVHTKQRSKPSRILPSISTIPITSTPNDTTNDELTNSIFHDDDIEELSNVQSGNISLIDSQLNHIESPIDQRHDKSIDKTESLNHSLTQNLYTSKARRTDATEILISSSSSPKTSLPTNSSNIPLLNHSLTQTLHTPKARRTDGTEVIISSSSPPKTSLPTNSSNILLFNHCHFPRSLTSREKLHSNSISKRQLPSLPIVQSYESKQQFHSEELYNLLDHLDENKHNNFTNILEQLTLSTVVHQDETQQKISSIENLSHEVEEKENILPNLFSQSFSSSQEKLFYSKFIFNIPNPKNLSLYTMTLGTVQLSASILLPYSILTGRRPLLKCSNQTNFKPIHSKQKKSIYQVTAIESSLNNEQLQQNDILLEINDESIWGLSINVIIEILKQSNSCSLTIARLCQPFI